MEQALRNAIYYVEGNDDSYLKYNIVAEILYDGDKKSLQEVTDYFRSDIRIRNLFGNKENICYEICDRLSNCYDSLLLDRLDVILIVTRHDNAIKITRSINNGSKGPTKKSGRLISGIIKLDGVIAELYSINFNQRSYWYYPILTISVMGLGVLLRDYVIDFAIKSD